MEQSNFPYGKKLSAGNDAIRTLTGTAPGLITNMTAVSFQGHLYAICTARDTLHLYKILETEVKLVGQAPLEDI